MKISKSQKSKIRFPRDGEEWFCPRTPNRCSEPAMCYKSVADMRADNLSRSVVYWFHPDTALTPNDIEDETLFLSKKRKFGEKNSIIYCVASSKNHIFGVLFNSRTAFVAAIKDVDWIYPYAAMPVGLFLRDSSIPRTIKLDDETAFYDEGKLYTPKFVPLPIKDMITWLSANPNLSPTVLTSVNMVEHEDFWGMMPWELDEKYGNIYVITEETSNISGASVHHWNHRSLVGAVNEIKETVTTKVTGDIYLLGTGSHQSILSNISHIASVDKIAVVDELNGNVVCTVPRSICDNVEQLSIKQLYDALPPKTLLPARFTIADLDASHNPEPYMSDVWTLCVESNNSIHTVTCIEDNLMAYISLYESVQSTSTLIGLYPEGNKKFITCMDVLYESELSHHEIFDMCVLAAIDGAGILSISHSIPVLFYLLAANSEVKLDCCTFDATISATGYLNSDWVNSHITNRTVNSTVLNSDKRIRLSIVIRHLLSAIDKTEGALGEAVEQRLRYARLMLPNKIVPLSLFAINKSLY